MKLQIENNSTSDFTDIPSHVSSANGSAEVTELLGRGIKAAQNGSRAEARHLLMQATELEPKNENAWLWLASISEYPEELLIFLSNVLSVNPQNERALEWEKSTKSLLSKTFVQRGIEASKQNQSAVARQSFLQAIVHDDKNEMAWLWLASISEFVEEKRSHLQKVLNINPANETAAASLKTVKTEMAQALLQKACAEALAGENESAAKMVSDILSNTPDLEDAWMLRSFLTDSFKEKVECFEKIVDLNPENESAVSCLASMKLVIERTEPKAASDEVEYFDFDQDASQEENTGQEDISEFAEENSELLGEESAKPYRDEEEEVAYLSNETSDFPAQGDEFSEDSVQYAETFEEAEEFSTVQIEKSEEMFETDEKMFAPDEEVFVSSQHEEVEVQAEVFLQANQEKPENDFEQIPFEAFQEEEDDDEVESVSTVSFYQDSLEDEQSFEEAQSFKSYEFEESFDKPQFAEQNEIENPFAVKFEDEEVYESQTYTDEYIEEVPEETKQALEKPKAEMTVCPFCESANEPQAFICISCRAMLTLSDIEMMLNHQEVDLEMMQQVVKRMEDENDFNKFDAEGLKTLGIGLLNLKDLRKGFGCLQKAAYLNPNDVVLNSQVNSLAIRLSEIEEQKNHQDSMPKNKTILVVDDSATVRKLISGKLEKCGLEVICATDGMDALEKINESIPDLILLDITMPRMDGYQVCKLIRGNEATKDVPVVMISGKDGFFDKVRGRMAGTTGYITKPFGPETLMKTVESYIEQS